MTADPRHDYLAAYRRSVESSAEVRQANLDAVLERARRVGAVEAAPNRWVASALVIKLTTVAVVTTGLGWGATSMLSADAPAPVAEVVAPATVQAPAAPESSPRAATPPAPAAPVSLPLPTEPAPVVRPAPRPRARTAAPKPEAAADRLREELALLESAQQHLAAGRPAQAHRALREHARRFPQGALSLERSAWSAIAACSGSGPQSKAAARSFILTHADIPLSAKIKVECGL